MFFTYKFSENLMKVFFSVIIIQLLCIATGAANGDYTPCLVLEMLEYPAASCVCALGGGLLMEYILKTENN